MVEVRRFDVFLIALDPMVGSEIKKTRPCVIISPDEMNAHIHTIIIAPMTTKGRDYPTRISLKFQGKQGQIILDQLRTVDKTRLAKKIGHLSDATAQKICNTLQEMFGF